jgi:hypothetical protein
MHVYMRGLTATLALLLVAPLFAHAAQRTARIGIAATIHQATISVGLQVTSDGVSPTLGRAVLFGPVAPAHGNDTALAVVDTRRGRLLSRIVLPGTDLESGPTAASLGLLTIDDAHARAYTITYVDRAVPILRAFDLTNGRLLYRRAVATSVPYGGGTNSSVDATSGDFYYVDSTVTAPQGNPRNLVLVSPDGTIRARVPVPDVYRFDVDGPRHHILVTQGFGKSGSIYHVEAFTIAGLQRQWSVSLPMFSSMAPMDTAFSGATGNLYPLTLDGQVVSVDGASGNLTRAVVGPEHPSLTSDYREQRLIIDPGHGTYVSWCGTDMCGVDRVDFGHGQRITRRSVPRATLDRTLATPSTHSLTNSTFLGARVDGGWPRAYYLDTPYGVDGGIAVSSRDRITTFDWRPAVGTQQPLPIPSTERLLDEGQVGNYIVITATGSTTWSAVIF